MINLLYNNNDIFSGLSPTPYVGLSEEPIFYNNRWALVDRITLAGQITGICQDSLTYLQSEDFQNILTESFDEIEIDGGGETLFSYLNTAKNELIYRLSKSFKDFEIQENNESRYYCPAAKILRISFEDSNWSRIVPYTIELEGYRSGLFSGFYGVINPKNEFSFEKNEDGIIDLVHTCSAQGIKVSESHSIENAKAYVSSISGWNSQVLPLFNGNPNASIILKTIQENENRMDGSYSLVERYRYDPDDSTKGLLRYSVDLRSGDDGFVNATIDGEIEGGKNTTIEDLRFRYSGISFYTRASQIYNGLFLGSLNSQPESFSFEEDSFNKNITFSISYNNDSYPNPYLIDSTNISINQNGENSISIQGTARWRGKCLCSNEYGWNQLQNFIKSYDFYGLASRKWSQYGKTSTLNPIPSSFSKTENKNSCSIQISMNFEETQQILPIGLDYFDYTISVSPAIPIYSSTPVIPEGNYSIMRLNYDRRATFTIQGQAKIKDCFDKNFGISIIKGQVNSLAGIYVIGTRKVLQSSNFSEGEGENDRIVSFSYSWTSEAPRSIIIPWEK